MSNERQPRGILPTIVNDELVALCKFAPRIRDSYEIRLALYMAVSSNRQFVLGIAPGAEVEEEFAQFIAQHGGEIKVTETSNHSIYFACVSADGAESDGWVFGNNEAFATWLTSAGSTWIKGNLYVGACFSGEALGKLRAEVERLETSVTNIDEEPVKDAILSLVAIAEASGGSVSLQ